MIGQRLYFQALQWVLRAAKDYPELYVEIIDAMLLILEGKEEYEKCQVLKNKKEECIKIIKQKK